MLFSRRIFVKTILAGGTAYLAGCGPACSGGRRAR